MSQATAVHLKGLNGIRAIAACGVLISHINESLYAYGLPNMHSVDLAGFGVTMFFSLSGFLITYLLLLEKQKYASINIKDFYIRRILRIWPLYYLFLFLAVIALLVWEKESLTNSIWYYLVLFANVPFIYQTAIAILRHYWSLGVEEQFYLFWPWVVKRTEKLLRWAIIFIAIMLALKFVCWLWFRKTGNAIPLSAVQFTRFHCMAIGAAGAILLFQNNQLFKRISFSLITQVLSFLMIVLMAFNKFDVLNLINDEIVAVVTVFLIMNVSQNPRSLVRFENVVMDYLGKISYGIYIYHPLFIFLGGKLLADQFASLGNPWQYVAIYLFIIGSTIVVAGLSYTYFEKRFIGLKGRFTRIHSEPSKKTEN